MVPASGRMERGRLTPTLELRRSTRDGKEHRNRINAQHVTASLHPHDSPLQQARIFSAPRSLPRIANKQVCLRRTLLERERSDGVSAVATRPQCRFAPALELRRPTRSPGESLGPPQQQAVRLQRCSHGSIGRCAQVWAAARRAEWRDPGTCRRATPVRARRASSGLPARPVSSAAARALV